MLKIKIKKNRYTENQVFAVEEWDLDSDFYIHIGHNIEVMYNPLAEVIHRTEEHIGSIVCGVSAHDLWPDCDAPLGYPVFSDDFIVFKNSPLGVEIYYEWLKTKNITLILTKYKLTPSVYPKHIIKSHIDPRTRPNIVWGQ